MAISKKMLVLLSTLVSKTLEGGAKWTQGSGADTFIWSGSSASILLTSKDNDGQAPWIVRIIDADGRIVESETVDGSDDEYDLIEDLYAAARASALDIDKTIDGLLGDLEPF